MGELGYEEFVARYALPGLPVVIRGGAWDVGRRDAAEAPAGASEGAPPAPPLPPAPWSLRWLAAGGAGRGLLHGARCTLKERVADSLAWAGLEDAPGGEGAGDAAKFVGELLAAGGGDEGGGDEGGGDAGGGGSAGARPSQLYLHDWSLPTHRPALLRHLRLPAFFAHNDLLRQLHRERQARGAPRALLCGVWPSLFVGPRGSSSGTHVDSGGTHFWMALFEGRKRWWLFDRRAAPLLRPRWHPGCAGNAAFEGEWEGSGADPAAMHAAAAHCACFDLQPGDLLFVPAGCPHRVLNLSDTVAVSANFVDGTNLHVARRALRAMAHADARAGELLRALPSRRRGPERALLCPRPRPVAGAAMDDAVAAGARSWAVAEVRCWLGSCSCDTDTKCAWRRRRRAAAEAAAAAAAAAEGRGSEPSAKRRCGTAEELLADLLGGSDSDSDSAVSAETETTSSISGVQ